MVHCRFGGQSLAGSLGRTRCGNSGGKGTGGATYMDYVFQTRTTGTLRTSKFVILTS